MKKFYVVVRFYGHLGAAKRAAKATDGVVIDAREGIPGIVTFVESNGIRVHEGDSKIFGRYALGVPYEEPIDYGWGLEGVHAYSLKAERFLARTSGDGAKPSRFTNRNGKDVSAESYALYIYSV